MKWCAWLVLWPTVLVAAAVAEGVVDEEPVSPMPGGQPELYIPLNGLLRLVSSGRQVKRDPFGINARGFHENVFDRDYGSFSPMRKRSVAAAEDDPTPQRTKRSVAEPVPSSNKAPKFEWNKRRPEMDSSGFHGDTFSSGFGDFWTMRKKSYLAAKRRPEMDSAGFYGDTFTNGFGDFWTVRKKSPHYRLPQSHADLDYDWQPK